MKSKLSQRTRLLSIGMLAVAAFGLSGCTGGDGFTPAGNVDSVSGDLSSSIDSAIESAMQLSGSTQAVVGVWSGEEVYVNGYGDDVTGSTKFRGAQTTQPMVCALLLEMVRDGEVKLDEEVVDAIPRQSGIEGITYQQLCDMRSGLGNFTQSYVDINANNPARVWPTQELLSEGLAHSPVANPGAKFASSDTNAVLLGRALRITANESLPELLDEHVFDQVNMPSSSYFEEGETSVSGDALTPLTYPSSGGAPACDAGVQEPEAVSPTMLGAAGGIATTVTDIKNFYTSYFAGDFGGKKLIEQDQPTVDVEGGEEDNGVHWGFGTEKVESLNGRAGSMTGSITAAYHDPASDFTVVVALNNSSAGKNFARALAFQLAAISSAAGSGPEVSWSADDQAAKLAEAAVCQEAPAEEAPAEEAPAE